MALAILFNNDVALDIVWRQNADNDIVDNNGDTLLHLACRGHSYTIVKHVAYHQRNVNARNDEQNEQKRLCWPSWPQLATQR